MPNGGGSGEPGFYTGVLNYTVGHEKRVERLAVAAYDALPRAVKNLIAEGIEIPDYVLGCLDDDSFRHDLKVSGGNHDWAKGDWPPRLLCGEDRPTLNNWLEYIYSHPMQGAQNIHRKGLEETLHISERAIEFLKCHHMRNDANNLGYDGNDLWFKGDRVVICRHEAVFYSPGPGPRWHKNIVIIDGCQPTKYLGYGPMEVYLLTGESLPFGAEILKVADAYDSMTSNRKHRHRNMTHEEAVAELRRKAGTEFNPIVVSTFELIPPEIITEITRRKAA